MRAHRALGAAALLLALVGCTGARDVAEVERAVAAAEPAATSTTTGLQPATTAPPAPPPPVTTTPPAPQRAVFEQAWAPMALVGEVLLVHPATRVERVGFHQSNHEGAREMAPLPTAVQSVTLESRQRLSGARSAADVVVDPAEAIRAPVSGVVKRAGTYVLYCRYSDDYVVIEPDGRPGWEVKMLHISGEQVSRGQRVEAGVTQVAARATQLPFESQVDELRTADPAWPHVHIEVVDPTIPNVASPGGGC
ncbi:MAG: hypothetical protein ACLGHT_03595 [Acidimicrobiia bacterium]